MTSYVWSWHFSTGTADKVLESSGADSFSEGSGRLMRSWRVLVQIAVEVPEGSGE